MKKNVHECFKIFIKLKILDFIIKFANSQKKNLFFRQRKIFPLKLIFRKKLFQVVDLQSQVVYMQIESPSKNISKWYKGIDQAEFSELLREAGQ